MYHHVVLFRLKEKTDTSKFVSLLESLVGPVESLRHLTVGQDDSPSERSSDLCLITQFDDLSGYEQYRTHPFHLAVLDQLKPMVAESRKVDWG